MPARLSVCACQFVCVCQCEASKKSEVRTLLLVHSQLTVHPPIFWNFFSLELLCYKCRRLTIEQSFNNSRYVTYMVFRKNTETSVPNKWPLKSYKGLHHHQLRYINYIFLSPFKTWMRFTFTFLI